LLLERLDVLLPAGDRLLVLTVKPGRVPDGQKKDAKQGREEATSRWHGMILVPRGDRHRRRFLATP
jgi:hypothetical protein